MRTEADYASLSRTGAAWVAERIREKPDLNLLAATGNTPLGLYEGLAARYRAGELDPSRLCVFQLDEYLGVGDEDPRSLYGWLARALLRPLDIRAAQVVRLPGDGNAKETCRRYDEAVQAVSGLDLAVLGLGPNGHLGFNEPPSDAHAKTRVLSLTEASLASSAGYWGDMAVPTEAITAGMDVILGAKRILLVVSGAHKREVLRRALHGPVTPELPASYLRAGASVTVLTDRAAYPGA